MQWLTALREGQELYQITLDDQGPIIFKLLPYSSFLHYQRLLLQHPRTAPLVEDEIWISCVLAHPYTDPLDELLAGTVSTVAELILFLSGLPDFQDKQTLLEHSRAMVQSDLLLQLQAAVCQAFPSYTPEQLNQLTLQQLMLRLAQAEQVLGQQFNIEAPDNPKAKAATSRQPISATQPQPTSRSVIDFEAENRRLQEFGIDSDYQDDSDPYS